MKWTTATILVLASALLTSGIWLHQYKVREKRFEEKLVRETNESFHQGKQHGYKVGYNEGYAEGNRTGYFQGVQAGLRKHPDVLDVSTASGHGSLEKFYINGYYFRPENLSQKLMGYTWTHNNTIVLESLMTRYKTLETCQHEIVHQKFPEYRHAEQLNRETDLIYQLEDEFVSPTCLMLIDKLRFN